MFDLGLWDQHGYADVDGFRGWSGSRQGRVANGQTPVYVQQDVAQRGYRPGVIEAGTWYVEIGVAAVTPAPAGATWTASVTCTARPRRSSSTARSNESAAGFPLISEVLVEDIAKKRVFLEC